MAWGVPKLGTLVEDATGNFDLIEPVGVAEGDLMIACIAYRGNAAVTLTDWTAVATAQNSGDTDSTNGIASGAMFYIVRGASAPNLTVTRTAGDVVLARVISYSGGHSSPYDTGTANTLASASVTVTTGTFSTAEDGELIVAMTSGGDNYSATAFDATDPGTASGATDTTTAPTAGTWIERQDSGTNTGADASLAIADAIRATAGATGTIQATLSGSGRSVMIAGAFKLAPAAEGPITLDAISNGSSSDYADTSYTWNHTVAGTDRILIVWAGIWQDADSGTVTGVTYNGSALTNIRTDDNVGMYSSLWYIIAPDTGTNAIVVSQTGNAIQSIGEAISLNGVAQTSPIEANNGDATDALKTVDVAVTTLTNDAWVVGGAIKFGTEVLTPAATTTETHETTLANVTGALGYQEQPTAGSTELEWTWITNDRDAAISAAAVKPAGGVATVIKDVIGMGLIPFAR